MITITNGVRAMTVSKGAFKTLFEPNGWKIASLTDEKLNAEDFISEDEKEPESSNLPPLVPPEDEDEEEVEEEEDEEVEKPISEMTVEELKEYAHELGLDISKAKNKKELRHMISSAIEEE